MQAILFTEDPGLTNWIVAFERLGPFGIQVVLLTAMVWYLRKHIARLLDSKRQQSEATSKAVPIVVSILNRIATSLDALLRRHEQTDQVHPGSRPVRGDRGSVGGAVGKDLSRTEAE